jgi:DNA-directed RNA polymerase specialized sigma24 family protein
MMTQSSVHRADFRCTEFNGAVLKQRSEGSDRLSGPLQTSVPIVPDKDEHAAFDEVFAPHMAEAFRLARWLTGNASDAEDVIQDAALRAFRGIRGFGAVNARAWSLTIVRNTAYSWLMKNRPKAVVFTNDLSVSEQQELEHGGALGGQVETPEEIALAASAGRAAAAVSRSDRVAGNQSVELSRYRGDHRRSDRNRDVPSVPGQATPGRASRRPKVGHDRIPQRQ